MSIVVKPTQGQTTASRPRAIRAPRGQTLSCKGWQQEAALRMLMNNLDPDVAERPQIASAFRQVADGGGACSFDPTPNDPTTPTDTTSTTGPTDTTDEESVDTSGPSSIPIPLLILGGLGVLVARYFDWIPKYFGLAG